jgi:PrcB C-terminal
MNPRFALLASVAALWACAGSSTMRVSQEGANGDEPVSLAPAPEDDSTSLETPASPAPETPIQDTAGSGQGYAPYGNPPAAVQANNGSLELRRIGQWSHTGIREARRMVIQDANAWAQFWSELGVGNRPAVDFSRDVVIAVAAGERSTGGNEIAVTQVSQSNGELTAEVQEIVPGPNCITTSALIQPVDVVVVPGVNPKSWSFVERREVRGCRP